MATPREKQLVVEGPNDKHALLHLLIKSGVLPDDKVSSPLDIEPVNSKSQVLDDLPVRWKQTGMTSIGYVLDADDRDSDPPGCQSTWNAVGYRLRQLNLQVPVSPPSNGFISRVGDNGPRIGVWIMPDNASDGELEEFLIALIDPTNPLLQFAQTSTQLARTDHGAEFDESNQKKAELSCWLAWQEEPAQPYGLAMQAGKFNPQHELAARFIKWTRTLFEL